MATPTPLKSLEALVRNHWRQIRQWALYECGDPAWADDVAQETWLRVTRSKTVLDDGRNPRGWLKTVVRSVARDLGRKESRMARGVPTPDPLPDLDVALDTKRAAARMLAAFERLTPRQREAVDRVDRLGQTTGEAAAEMEISPATVRVLLHQGRRALREHLVDLEEVVDAL